MIISDGAGAMREPAQRTENLDQWMVPGATATRVAQALEPILGGLAENALDCDKATLRAFFADPIDMQIDYDYYASVFAGEYWMRNFHKTALALQRDGAVYHRRVADLGCGSAAVTLAYLAHINDTLSSGPWRIEIQLVDRSERQLALAKQLLAAAQKEFTKIEVSATYVHADIRNWVVMSGESLDCVFFGHVLTENRTDLHHVLQRGLNATDRNAQVYVFERSDDPVWGAIDDEVRNLALPAHPGSTVDETVPVSFETRYVRLSVPNRKELVALIHHYFAAWREQSTDLLDGVFTDRAVYHEKPFEAPFDGIEEIRRYWCENVLQQRDANIEVTGVLYTDDWAVAEWSARFVDADARHKAVAGVLILVTRNNCVKAAILREYFGSMTT